MEQFPTPRIEEAASEQAQLVTHVHALFQEQAETVGIWIPDSPEIPIHTMLVGRLSGESIPAVYQDAWIAVGHLNMPDGTSNGREVITVAIKNTEQTEGNVMVRIINGQPRYITQQPLTESQMRSLSFYLDNATWDADLSQRWASPIQLA